MSTHAKQCTACGSTELMPNLSITDHGYMNMKHKLAIEIDGKPNAFIFKDTKRGVLRACVCGTCGHVDLMVDDAGQLLAAYRKHTAERL